MFKSLNSCIFLYRPIYPPLSPRICLVTPWVDSWSLGWDSLFHKLLIEWFCNKSDCGIFLIFCLLLFLCCFRTESIAVRTVFLTAFSTASLLSSRWILYHPPSSHLYLLFSFLFIVPSCPSLHSFCLFSSSFLCYLSLPPASSQFLTSPI